MFIINNIIILHWVRDFKTLKTILVFYLWLGVDINAIYKYLGSLICPVYGGGVIHCGVKDFPIAKPREATALMEVGKVMQCTFGKPVARSWNIISARIQLNILANLQGEMSHG